MTLIESIYNEPEKWRATEYTFNHADGAQLWIANGVFFCEPYNGGSFGFIQKIRAYSAYRWWTKNAPVEAFN